MKKIILLKFALLLAGMAFSIPNLTINPTIGSPIAGCYLSSTSTVTITVANIGTTTHFGTVNVHYILDGGAPVLESFSTPIPAGGTYIYSFVVKADMSACMMHTLEFQVFPVSDSNPLDNILLKNIASDCDPVVGAISGPDTVCAGLNAGDLTLIGYTGNIDSWENSTDGISWTSIANTTDTEPYLNIPVETYYWTIVESQFGLCPNDTTEIDTIRIDPVSIGGTLPADFDICDNANGGVIDLTGFVGNISHWEYSQDGGITWDTIWVSGPNLTYANLTDTTIYQVSVQSGLCPAVYSSTVTLTLLPGSDAGSIIGESLVCNFENDSFLLVGSYNGVVIDWIYSSDSGATYLSSGVSTDTYDYSGLLGYTIYGAVVQEGACPPDTTFHSITVLPVSISAGPNVDIFEGDSTLLTGSGGDAYFWFPDTDLSDPNSVSTWANPMVTTTYFLEVTDISGCKDTASVTVTILPNITELIIPNLITPNGDGFNDFLNIAQIDIFPNNEFFVFNGFGQMIYQAQPYNNDWYGTFNGDNLPDGTYYYVLRLNDTLLDINEYQGIITILGND